MSEYKSRGLECVWQKGQLHQVTLLEGRRAIGKTRLAQHLVDTGFYQSYSTLLDPLTLELATDDALSWLNSLSLPAVIDEAQLAPQLLIPLKALVDQLGVGHHFLLTGSASIGLGTAVNTNPLAGRLIRHALRPFTSFELQTGTGQNSDTAGIPSLVDLLFDGPITSGNVEVASREQLVSDMRKGGVPLLALAQNELPVDAVVQADTLALLGDKLLPNQDFDAFRARAVLDALLRISGGLLNMSRIGGDLGIDRRTVDRYISILRTRFLIDLLPNIAVGPAHASRVRPKVHATDSALIVEALERAGADMGTDPQVFGQVFETWVYQQLVAAASWSYTSVNVGFWRNNKENKEVDLVLIDGKGRIVGVECKGSSQLSATDTRGLKALRQAKGLYRGFVVYTGDQVRFLGQDLWGLPVEMLRRPSAWDLPFVNVATMEN